MSTKKTLNLRPRLYAGLGRLRPSLENRCDSFQGRSNRCASFQIYGSKVKVIVGHQNL